MYLNKITLKFELESSSIENCIKKVKDLDEKKIGLVKNLSENKKSNLETTINQSIKLVKIELEQSIETLVELFLGLIDFCERIKETKCSNLKSYLFDMIKYFGTQVKFILKKYVFILF
jgi:hypothetical protein